MPDFFHPLHRTGLRFVAQVIPRLDSGQDGLEPVSFEPFQVRLRQERQTALGDEIDAAGRHGLLDCVHVVVESDTKVRIVPAYTRPPELPQEKSQVLFDHIEVQGLIGYDRIDTKVAGVRTSQASEHRNDLDEGCLPESLLDELPALAYPGERCGMLSGCDVYSDWPVLRAVTQDVTDHRFVGETQGVVEVLPRVLRIAAGVRATENGESAVPSEQVAQRVGQLCSMRERAYEHEINVVW